MTGFKTKVSESFDLMYFNGLFFCIDVILSVSSGPTETKCIYKATAS